MDSSTVGLTIDWAVPSGEAGCISAALHALMVMVRAEPGCLECVVSVHVGAHSTVRYSESWRTEEDMRSHIQSERFTQLAGLVESATSPPRIEFRLPHDVRGIEYAVAVRGQ